MERPLNFLWAFNRLVDGIGGKNVNLSIDVQLAIGMLLTTLPQILYINIRWEVVDIYPVPIQLHHQEVVESGYIIWGVSTDTPDNQMILHC